MENTIIIILFFSYSFFVGFLIHNFLILRSKKYNIHKANTTAVRWEQQSKPIFGGITFFSLFIFALINYIFLFKGDFLISATSLAIILVVTISFFMGLADDLLNTPPMFKFVMQLVVAVILISFDIYIKLFNYETLNYLLTIFWVVGIMNSVNMLDNMDAITTSTSLIILTGIGILICFYSPTNQWYYLTLTAGIIASLGSFLIFNWNPSKMYMGDNGSQFLGAILAVLSIIFIWNQSNNIPSNWSGTYKLTNIILFFCLPIIDTTTVSINRILKGKSPFVGGKDHTTHHLSYLGLSDRQVALFFIIGQIISVGLALILMFYTEKPNLKTQLIFLIWPAILFAFLYTLTRTIKPNK